MPISKEEFTEALGEILEQHKTTSRNTLRSEARHFWIGMIIQSCIMVGALVGFLIKNESRFTSLEVNQNLTHEELQNIRGDVREIRNIANEVHMAVRRQGQDR
jgi:hypothetical protein